MQTETAEQLLDAVGITIDTGGTCTAGHRLFMGGEYTGPAIGTPELDALLLVAGQRWLVENVNKSLWHVMDALPDNKFHNPALTLLLNDLPGHALARAIREVGR